MVLLFWLTVCFILTGLVVLLSMKKNMEDKLAFIKANMDNDAVSIQESTQSIIWWIVVAATWGVVSIILVVWWFHVYTARKMRGDRKSR